MTTLVFAASYGIAFGAIQQLPQILGAPNRGHVEIVAEADAARTRAIADAAAKGQPAPPEPRLRQIAGNATDQAVATVSSWQEMGGLVGRAVFALHRRVGASRRRSLLRIFQIPALIFVPLFFWWISSNLATPGFADAGSRSASSSPASSPSRSSASGETTSRWCSRCTCAAPARASPPTSAAA